MTLPWAVLIGLIVVGLCVDNGLTNIAKQIGKRGLVK